MRNNRRNTKVNDGTTIKLSENPIAGNSCYTWYEKDSALNALNYGALYNVTVINNGNSKNVCPVGWQVADIMDWSTLIMAAGGYASAGSTLKAPQGWRNPSIGGPLNFNAMPGGEYTLDDSGMYRYVGKYNMGIWWGIYPDPDKGEKRNSSTYYELTDAGGRVYQIVTKSDAKKFPMRSIRCVKYDQ